ncbi:hypothetical protein BCY86_03620 [Pajaroellobacter abortibovis]|uniref:Leucyl/phenylalanyl-tRNA--protein transferase n=1 Tax=Pajaroellobacter abortibovis TaxID=1882918 RepID=A0A1L6MWG3_9BACT|nr:hypothetical protein BCY86_03620 [Pajaroellobacter abortibovis]
MFHRENDASKVVFAGFAEFLQKRGFTLFDVQILTPHLQSLGCIQIPRKEFLHRHRNALLKPVSLTL